MIPVLNITKLRALWFAMIKVKETSTKAMFITQDTHLLEHNEKIFINASLLFHPNMDSIPDYNSFSVQLLLKVLCPPSYK
jgi:hypothetical protein